MNESISEFDDTATSKMAAKMVPHTPPSFSFGCSPWQISF